jgi:hypothetical protein
MNYVVALLAGVSVVTLVLAAGAGGYMLARAKVRGLSLLAVCLTVTVLYGAVGLAVGSALYTRLAMKPVAAAINRGPATPAAAQPTPGSAANDQPQAATDAWLHFDSDTGDYIGAGKHEVWTLGESNISISGDASYLRAYVSGQGDEWQLWFRAPSNGSLRVGTYLRAERAAFVTGKAPGLDVFGSGRGCNTVSGQFQITKLTWTSSGAVADIDVLFERHCEGGTAALRGELWVSTVAGAHRAPPNAASPITL